MTFTRNFSIGTKYLSVFFFSILLFIVATVVVFFQLNTAKDNVHEIIQKSQLANDMAQLALHVERQDSIISEYVIVGGNKYVEEFNEVNNNLEEVVNRLEKEISGERNEFLFTKVVENMDVISDIFLNEMVNDGYVDEEDLIYPMIQISTQKTAAVTLINQLIDAVNEEESAATAQVNNSMDQSIVFLITVNVVSILI